jgi:hypothetical protein
MEFPLIAKLTIPPGHTADLEATTFPAFGGAITIVERIGLYQLRCSSII